MAETVNVVVCPELTVVLGGVIVPPDPALAVTVYVMGINDAWMVQLSVTGPVVYVFPESVPPQPVTL